MRPTRPRIHVSPIAEQVLERAREAKELKRLEAQVHLFVWDRPAAQRWSHAALALAALLVPSLMSR